MGLTERLNSKVPLGGPGWLDWGKLMTGVAVVVLGPMILFVAHWTLEQRVIYSSLPSRVELLEVTMQDSVPKLDKILEMMEQNMQRDMILVGKARIVADGGKAGVWLNEFGKAIKYKNSGLVCVTNLSYIRERTRDLIVLGTIKDSDNEVLMEITKPAAQLLMANGEVIDIRIEPVKEKNK